MCMFFLYTLHSIVSERIWLKFSIWKDIFYWKSLALVVKCNYAIIGVNGVFEIEKYIILILFNKNCNCNPLLFLSSIFYLQTFVNSYLFVIMKTNLQWKLVRKKYTVKPRYIEVKVLRKNSEISKVSRYLG